MDRSRWAVIVGAVIYCSALIIVSLDFSGVCNTCGLGGYCWACFTGLIMSGFVLLLLPPVAGWLWVSKDRTETSVQHADRFNDFMNTIFTAAALFVLWIAQLMVSQPMYGYPAEDHQRRFLVETGATVLAALAVGFWTVRRRP
jgi:hypothetical protein